MTALIMGLPYLLQGGPVSCPLCRKVFTRKDNMRVHIRLVHQGEKKHSCRFCGRRFGTSIDKRRHEERHELKEMVLLKPPNTSPSDT